MTKTQLIEDLNRRALNHEIASNCCKPTPCPLCNMSREVAIEQRRIITELLALEG